MAVFGPACFPGSSAWAGSGALPWLRMQWVQKGSCWQPWGQCPALGTLPSPQGHCPAPGIRHHGAVHQVPSIPSCSQLLPAWRARCQGPGQFPATGTRTFSWPWWHFAGLHRSRRRAQGPAASCPVCPPSQGRTLWGGSTGRGEPRDTSAPSLQTKAASKWHRARSKVSKSPPSAKILLKPCLADTSPVCLCGGEAGDTACVWGGDLGFVSSS